jgi:Tfp pilus assembly protein PilP
MRFVKTLVLGITLAAITPGLHAQAKPASGTGANPATPAAAKPAPQAAKPAEKTTAKPAAQTPAKPAAAPASAGQNKPAASDAKKSTTAGAKAAAPSTGVKAVPQAAKPVTPASKKAPKQTAKKAAPRTTKPATSARSSAAEDKEPKVAKRDPFESLIGREHTGPRTDLPAGKAGLQVSTLRLDGVVRAPNGMIAVVSNPQSRTYFLRDGDQLFDGRVEKIAMDGVSFHEVGKDAFGKPVERQVNKRIYASAGEQQ